MNYQDFCKIWNPVKSDIKNQINTKQIVKMREFNDFSASTQDCIKSVLYSYVKTEENFETRKSNLTQGKILEANKIFEYMDISNNNWIGYDDFCKFLQNLNLECTRKESELLYKQFDKHNIGKITFNDIRSSIYMTE